MKGLWLSFVVCLCFAQGPPRIPPVENEDVKLPNGKSQRDAIIKADHEKNVEEASELAKIAEELKADLEKSDRNIVSVRNIKQTEEIEKLARNIRSRLKRY